MKKHKKSTLDAETDFNKYIAYKECVGDLLQNEAVLSMNDHIQHGDITCLEHCVHVSYRSFLLSRKLGVDDKAAARGGLLHDFFLYDWHKPRPEMGLHGFTHARESLNNANKHFILSDKEQDIILKHMWPLNWKIPKHKESFVIILVDKYCAIVETLNPNTKGNVDRLIRKLLL